MSSRMGGIGICLAAGLLATAGASGSEALARVPQGGMRAQGQGQRQAQTAPPLTARPEGPALRLEDLERMALENNPTMAQAEAAVRAAEGRRVQAGLFP